jgi:hypothetical protein
MRRSKFQRLGEHTARDRAGELRRKVAAGGPDALQAQTELLESATPEAVRAKAFDLLLHSLKMAVEVFQAEGLCPPLDAPTPQEHAVALLAWTDQQNADPDSLRGRMIRLTRQCAHGLVLLADGPLEAALAMAVGYGVAQTHFLALREYGDGPEIARERSAGRGRAEGGKSRKDGAKAVHAEIAADFMEARRVNPRISANGFAKKNAERHLERFGLAPETVRKIAGNALRRAKNRTSAS